MGNKEEKLKRRLALTRECGLCRACCTTQEVSDFASLPRGLTPEEAKSIETSGVGSGRIERIKPADVPCPFLAKDTNAKGCTIYKARPQSCRDWMCVWRSGSDVLKGEERPDRLGIVLDTVSHPSLPFTFLVAVAVDAADAKGCFARAQDTISRLASRGHLVVCEYPKNSMQELFGPNAKVIAYQEAAKTTHLVLSPEQHAGAIRPEREGDSLPGSGEDDAPCSQP